MRDVLLILSKIKIYSFKKKEMTSGVPKKARELVQKVAIDSDLLREK